MPRTRRKASKPYKIKHEVVYPHQDLVALRILAKVLANESPKTKNKRSVVLIGQPQSGKTGVLIALIHAFIADCVKRKRTFQVIVICGLPHKSLTEQTRKRMTLGSDGSGRVSMGAALDSYARESGLQVYPFDDQSRQGILISHNSPTLRRLQLEAEVDVRLWIGDEVHLGNVESGNIDLLLQNHGVRIGEQIHAWDKGTINHFVGVSATPSAHMLKSENIRLDGEALFEWVYEPPPPEYNSLASMMAKGRLIQTEPLIVNETPTTFFQGVLASFQKTCKSAGPGHLVLRATGAKHAQLLTLLNELGRKIEIREFDDIRGNLDDINSYLSIKPSEPTFVLIRSSMRAGITLPMKHYIRGWVETESLASDAQAQAGAGRACGYGRTHDTYPIYCDLDHVRAWIRAYDALDRGRAPGIPSGVQNKKLVERRRYGIREVLPYREAWDTYVKPRRDAARDDKSRYRAQLATTQGNVFLDVAGLFLEGRRDSGSTVGIYVNGPTSEDTVEKFIKERRVGRPGPHENTTPEEVRGWKKRNEESYKKLVLAYPEAEGQAIIFDEGVLTVMAGQSRNVLQKPTSALRTRPTRTRPTSARRTRLTVHQGGKK